MNAARANNKALVTENEALSSDIDKLALDSHDCHIKINQIKRANKKLSK